jgi:hypothetical protein
MTTLNPCTWELVRHWPPCPSRARIRLISCRSRFLDRIGVNAIVASSLWSMSISDGYELRSRSPL